MMDLENVRLGVIGMGYVGLPLAVEFGKVLPTVGFDIDTQRIRELRDGIDHTREVEPELLAAAGRLSFESDPEALRECNV
jgi:UDP-N-acetyl-D-glucosamine/UDP-N-acetyl-D-galactosamine dehydrogenase